MSLNKLTELSSKGWMNIGCNSIDSKSLDCETDLKTGQLYVSSAIPVLPFYDSGIYDAKIGDDLGNFLTISACSCNWTRIGKRVFIDVFAQWSSKNATAGDLYMTLPSVVGGVDTRCTFAIGFCTGVYFTNPIVATALVGTDQAVFNVLNNAGGSPATLKGSVGINNTGQIQLSGSYFIN